MSPLAAWRRNSGKTELNELTDGGNKELADG
jgi:hypothetical protein